MVLAPLFAFVAQPRRVHRFAEHRLRERILVKGLRQAFLPTDILRDRKTRGT